MYTVFTMGGTVAFRSVNKNFFQRATVLQLFHLLFLMNLCQFDHAIGCIFQVDPSLNMKMESSKFDDNFDVVTLTATQAIDDEKFEAAANLVIKLNRCLKYLFQCV